MRWLLLTLMILIVFPIVLAQDPPDDPIDCDPDDPEIFPGQIEVPNDGIDNNCNMDESLLLDEDPNTGVDENDIVICNLIDLNWTINNQVVDEVLKDSIVFLRIIGTTACKNSTVNFDIIEKDTITFDDDITPDPLNQSFNLINGKYIAQVSWTALFEKDEFLELLTGNRDPDYFFRSQVDFVVRDSEVMEVREKILEECGDGNIDLGEDPITCPEDAGCKLDEKACQIGEDIICVNYTLNCTTPITPIDCIADLGCMTGNKCQVIDGNPNCACNTVSDGICTLDPSCQGTDPNCCSIFSAEFNFSCVPHGSNVQLIVKGNDACTTLTATYDLKLDKFIGEKDVTPDPSNDVFQNKVAVTTWQAIYDPGESNEYFYYADILELGNFDQFKSEELEVRECDLINDVDCDGVFDGIDECVETGFCASSNSEGCTDGQSSCLKDWDCSLAPWSECNEELNLKTRDTSLCIYNGDNPACTIDMLPSAKPCFEERPFPVFSSFNILITILLLISYYLYLNKNKIFK